MGLLDKWLGGHHGRADRRHRRDNRHSSLPAAACPGCRQPLPMDARFCPGCGRARTPPACGRCGGEPADSARFCQRCGAAL
nr:zinc ribbon domain-containing protein [Chromobacterium sp. ASV5]